MNTNGVPAITKSADAIVVGAGIVGAACAKELTDAGLRVTISDADVIAGGATGAAMGHLAVMDNSEAQFALTSYSQKLWRELAPDLPKDTEYVGCGSIWIAADEEELSEARRKEHFYSARGLPVEMIDGQQLADAEPNLRTGLAGGLIMHYDAICDPPRAAKYLVSSAQHAGASLIEGKRVVQVFDDAVRFDDGERLTAGAVILAAGTWVRQLIPGLPIIVKKGHLLITDRYPGFVRRQLIELGYIKSAHSTANSSAAASVAFNVQPRVTGQILIGSSRQLDNEDPGVELPIVRQMMTRAIEYMPKLAGLTTIRSWTGFRAATPDNLPLIGLAPRFDSVYLATGHEGLGISTSLATGRLIADELLGRPSGIPREPYSPRRDFVQEMQ